MRVRDICYTKNVTFPYNRGVQALLKKGKMTLILYGKSA